ncbi:pentapeptide repeat-containing protein [Amycolatopsis sp. NPDC003861]
MASTPDAESTTQLSSAREIIRSAAKWFIASLGGIGVVLIAGSQLSSIGSLPVDSTRFYFAVAGVIAGLAAILWAMWRVVDILSGKRWTFDDIVAEWNRVETASQSKYKKWRSRARNPVGWYLHEHPSSLGQYGSLPEIKDLYDESEPDREGLSDLVRLMDELSDLGATVDLDARFRKLRQQIALGVLVGAAGIILFAWAANPAKPDQPIPSLLYADLRNTNLNGASLRNANLTGANLTGASLRDSDLKGATIKDVIWSNTICPDGTNSNASVRTAQDGRQTPQTCEGHLIPG